MSKLLDFQYHVPNFFFYAFIGLLHVVFGWVKITQLLDEICPTLIYPVTFTQHFYSVHYNKFYSVNYKEQNKNYTFIVNIVEDGGCQNLQCHCTKYY